MNVKQHLHISPQWCEVMQSVLLSFFTLYRVEMEALSCWLMSDWQDGSDWVQRGGSTTHEKAVNKGENTIFWLFHGAYIPKHKANDSVLVEWQLEGVLGNTGKILSNICSRTKSLICLHFYFLSERLPFHSCTIKVCRTFNPQTWGFWFGCSNRTTTLTLMKLGWCSAGQELI